MPDPAPDDIVGRMTESRGRPNTTAQERLRELVLPLKDRWRDVALVVPFELHRALGSAFFTALTIVAFVLWLPVWALSNLVSFVLWRRFIKW